MIILKNRNERDIFKINSLRCAKYLISDTSKLTITISRNSVFDQYN